MPGALRILIGDDHPIVRAGLRQLLAAAGDIGEIAEAGDPQQILELARNASWDVIVLDLGLPGRGGLDVLRTLKQEQPRRPVLILSMHAEQQFALRALRAGASGYLTKETAGERLLEAVRRVADGGRYISPALAEQLAEAVTSGDRPRHAGLSDREFEVLRMIAAGKTVGEIAELLSLSVKTVSGYRTRILEKTGLRNNAEIMRYALDHDLVE
jgi:two-component system, NarL family, invasion response regulator UvrY